MPAPAPELLDRANPEGLPSGLDREAEVRAMAWVARLLARGEFDESPLIGRAAPSELDRQRAEERRRYLVSLPPE